MLVHPTDGVLVNFEQLGCYDYACCARELFEGTGLVVQEILIVAEIQGFEYSTEGVPSTQAGGTITVSKIALKLNFVVKVVGDPGAVPQVEINPQEHHSYQQVSEGFEGYAMIV
jgi:hypothetical protein